MMKVRKGNGKGREELGKQDWGDGKVGDKNISYILVFLKGSQTQRWLRYHKFVLSGVSQRVYLFVS